MIIWRGRGWLALVPLVACAIALAAGEGTTVGALIGAGVLLVGGLLLWLVGKRLNRDLPDESGVKRFFEPAIASRMGTGASSGEALSAVLGDAPGHATFFIRLEYVGLLLAVAAPIFLLIFVLVR